jgi:hypothetical protein
MVMVNRSVMVLRIRTTRWQRLLAAYRRWVERNIITDYPYREDTF